MSNSEENKEVWKNWVVRSFVILILFSFIMGSIYIFKNLLGRGTIFLGLFTILLGYGSEYMVLENSREKDTTISIYTLKSSQILIYGGFLLIIIGLIGTRLVIFK